MKTQSLIPFFAQFLNPTQTEASSAPITTLKAGTCGNDCDSDSGPPQQQQQPIMETKKAGKCGNDCDTDDDGFERLRKS